MIYDSILDVVGNTPAVRIRRLNKSTGPAVYLKLESFNPTNSVKDRAAIRMVHEAESAGLLRPGGTLVESSSGNFGKALAMIGAAKGYKVVIVVDPKLSESTYAFFLAMGATVDVVSTPDAHGSYQGPRLERVQQIIHETPGAVCLDQYNNPNNPRAHEQTTAVEVLRDFDTLDILVGSVSTGGHLSGTAKTIKQEAPQAHIIGVDVEGSGAFGFPYRPYLMNGIGLAWKPGNLHLEYIDEAQLVSDVDGFSASRLLARHEGILVGGSGGAVLFACLCAAMQRPSARTIVGIIPDTGANYLDQFYTESWVSAHNLVLYDSVDQLVEAMARYTTVSLHP